MVDPQIAWAKLKAMTEGARLASRDLWEKTNHPHQRRRALRDPRPSLQNRRQVASNDSDARIPKLKPSSRTGRPHLTDDAMPRAHESRFSNCRTI